MSDPIPDEFQTTNPEIISYNYDSGFFVKNPSWTDIPTLDADSGKEIADIIRENVPNLFANGARRRHAVITTLGEQYVRYRRAGCTPEESQYQAITRTATIADISRPGVYEHISGLDCDNQSEVTEHLESVAEEYFASLPHRSQMVIKLCKRLRKVLSVIANISDAPGLVPSDITLQDIYKDQPGQRDRILTSDNDAQIFMGSPNPDRGATVHDVEVHLDRSDLKELPADQPVHLTSDTSIRTRDIATYDTAYSRVLKKIFRAVQSELTLQGKQKPNPYIGAQSDDNAAVRAVLPYPESMDIDGEFASLTVQYWRRGNSDVTITTHPTGRINYEKDPTLSGSIEEISNPGVHTFLGNTIDAFEKLSDSQ
jgi:hypothetical protein